MRAPPTRANLHPWPVRQSQDAEQRMAQDVVGDAAPGEDAAVVPPATHHLGMREL
jgi:hypothetical protein